MDTDRFRGWALRAWRVYANAAGIGAIALVLGIGLVQAISGRDAVVTASNVRVEGQGTPFPVQHAPYRGRYGYVYDLERHEACPGEVVTIFETVDTVTPAVVTVRKPSILEDVRAYPNLQIDNPLPDSVRPGRWHVNISIVSHCANREWTDPVTEFDIEVAGS